MKTTITVSLLEVLDTTIDLIVERYTWYKENPDRYSYPLITDVEGLTNELKQKLRAFVKDIENEPNSHYLKGKSE